MEKMVLLDLLKALSANLCKQIAAGLFLRQKMKTSSNVLLEVEKWCPKTDSNRRPTAYKAVALPTELLRQEQRIIQMNVRLS